MAVNAARIVFPAEDRAEIAAAVTESLTTGAMTLGPYTRQFEAAFAAAHQTPNAIAVTSGTAALEIILRATGVEGKDVIVPANTFYATAASVLRAGARPVFADIDQATFALTPDTVSAALTPNTAAVVTVHIAGLVAPQTEALRVLCEQRGVEFVEDAAHAHGSTYDGKFAGSFSAAAAFSF
ncbi:MAG: DegT/DnrJ/EryC1/StrS family aminotransferase, partial [Actinomycetota bacterium]